MIEFSKPPRRPVGLRSTFKGMDVRQSLSVKMEEYADSSVAQAACLAGREIGGKFSVHRDWEGKRFIVTRTA